MALSGQITVTTAGTAVQGSNVSGNLFALKAHPDNADSAWVGEASGDVANTNGYPLDPGESIVLELANLNHLWFDAETNGDRVCWLKLN